MEKSCSKPYDIPLPLIYDASKELLVDPDPTSFYTDHNDKPFSDRVNFIRKNKITLRKCRQNGDQICKNDRDGYASESSDNSNKSNCCHHVKTKKLPKNGLDLRRYEKFLARRMQMDKINRSVVENKNEIVRLYQDDKPKPPVSSKMDWENYHDLETIYKFMNELEYEYPSICSTAIIGRSLEGRAMKLMKVSNSHAGNSAVWIDAGIHAREWIAPATATFLLNHIVRNFDSLPECMTNKDWYFLPVVNPDGYVYSHKEDRMWRKNRAYHDGQCVGVDLNRNFSLGWGGRGSSENPCHNFYRGPTPFSEPESAAVRDTLLYSGITFKVYLTLHSYGQMIMFPFAFQDNPCPDYTKLLQGATVMSKAIYDNNGNTYKVGLSRDVMYGASGTSNDWSYGAAGIPFCYLIELRSKEHRFKLPSEEIQLTGSEILSSVTALMNFVDNYKPPKLRTGSITEDWDSDESLTAYEVAPLGVETLGPWGTEAHRLFKKLFERLVEATRDPRAGEYLAQRISIAIQRGNAAIVLGTLPTGIDMDQLSYLLDCLQQSAVSSIVAIVNTKFN